MNKTLNQASSHRPTPTLTRRRIVLGALSVCAVAAAGACGLINPDIFDITIPLSPQEYTQDFGSNTGKVPSVPCTAAMNTCQTVANQVGGSIQGATAKGICESSTSTCSAEIAATLSYQLQLSNEQSFATSVGGKVVSVVRAIELKYGVPTNTTTFTIPEMMIYIAPQGVKSETDPKAVYIDKIPAIAAKQTLPADSGSLKIAAGTPAFEQFSYYVKNPTTPFNFLLVAKPKVKAGDDVPSGKIVIRITPQITVGLIPR